MTLANSNRRNDHAGDGTTVAFAVSFRFLDNSHLRVVLTDAVGVETAGVISSVTGVGNANGGVVTLAAAPAAGMTVTILGDTPLTQETDFETGGAMPEEVVERALDKITMQQQEQAEKLNRAVSLPEGYGGNELQFPIPQTGKGIKFDGNGKLVTTDNDVDSAAVAATNAASQAAQSASEAQSAAQIAQQNAGVVADATPTQAGKVFTASASDVQNGASGKVVDAAQLYAATAGLAARMSRGLFQQASQQNLDRQSFAAGVLDVFTDTSDIDLGASVNERYNASGDYLDAAQGEVVISSGSPIGNMTGGGGLAAAFDGNNSQAKAASASAVGATTYIGKDWGSGQSKVVKKVQIWGASDSGFEDGATGQITLRLQGSDDNFSSVVNLGSVTFSNALNNTMREIVPSSTTAYRYHRIAVESTSGGATNFVAELQFYEEQSGGSGSIQSNAFAAGSAPARVDVYLWHEAIDGVILNTDLVLSISRDSGNTWTTATLVKDSDMATGQLLRASGVDVSGQPSGTQIKYKVEFNNNKAQRLHGVSLQWG